MAIAGVSLLEAVQLQLRLDLFEKAHGGGSIANLVQGVANTKLKKPNNPGGRKLTEGNA